MDQSITEQIYDIVAQHGDFDRSTLGPTSTLKELGLDSLEAIEAIFEIEEHFNIQFPDRDPSFDDGSLGGLVDVVEKALAEKAAAGETAADKATAVLAH